MSSAPIAHSPDLRRLADQGYELSIASAYLLVGHVPYVTDQREVAFGTLVSKLRLAGDATLQPDTHVVFFVGNSPCEADGQPLRGLINKSARRDLGGGLLVDHTFSAKPDTPNHLYADYFDQITTYVAILGGPASVLDPAATAGTFKVVQAADENSPFLYLDTATSRADIGAIAERIAHQKIGIIGTGGTGGYVLDFVAKSPVAEIHLFDDDVFGQHNAFRAPGATPADELGGSKVDHWVAVYSRMRRGVIPHAAIDESTVAELDGLDFVFVAMDPGPAKAVALTRLAANGTPFVDVGMGIAVEDGVIAGLIRTTISTSKSPAIDRISADQAGDDDYDNNVQIVELNALNAALAVIAWKKFFGFYRDLSHEIESNYQIDLNIIINDRPK